MLIKFYKDPMRYIKIPLIVVGTLLFAMLVAFAAIKLKPYCKTNRKIYLFGKPSNRPQELPTIIEEDNRTQTKYLALTPPENSKAITITPSAPPSIETSLNTNFLPDRTTL